MESPDKTAVDAEIRSMMPFEHRWHNRFHFEMPFGKLGSPCGLTVSRGIYHLFFRWNPSDCNAGETCWGHVMTRDFLRYSYPQLALWPSDAFDADGCLSGCGFADNSHVRVLYSGICVKDGQIVPSLRTGTLQGDGTIAKDPPFLTGSPEGYTGHFRDPYLFHRHSQTYFTVGAQSDDGHASALVYEKTPNGWENRGALETRLGRFGHMWESPNLLRFGSYDALLFCPQGLDPREFDRQNLYQSGYIAGHASLDAMAMLQHSKFQELDHGFDFYAPQVFQHEGRHILIGWMGMPDRDDEYPTREKGWMHTLTLPRVLTLRQGHIYAQPLRELRALRIQETALDIDADMTKSLHTELFDGSEVLLDIVFGKAQKVTLELVYGLEKIVLSYDRKLQIMRIDRNGMQNGGRGVRQFRLFADRVLSLQLFIDQTAVEAFFQHGEETATFYAFPAKHIRPELRLSADAAMETVSGRVWELDHFRYLDCI